MRKKFLVTWLLLSLLPMSAVAEDSGNSGEPKKDGCVGPLIQDQKKFEAKVEEFLQAVKVRDFGAFALFLKKDLPFKAVLPGGKVFTDVPSFMANQKTWFEGNTGSFDYKIDQTQVAGDLGVAVVAVHYENFDAAQKHFALEIYITFVFRQVEGQWYLVYDQNTVVKETR